jgi:hypothetical protein
MSVSTFVTAVFYIYEYYKDWHTTIDKIHIFIAYADDHEKDYWKLMNIWGNRRLLVASYIRKPLECRTDTKIRGKDTFCQQTFNMVLIWYCTIQISVMFKNNNDFFSVTHLLSNDKESPCFYVSRFRFRIMVFNAFFNNISVISWRSILLVEKTGVPGENICQMTNYNIKIAPFD